MYQCLSERLIIKTNTIMPNEVPLNYVAYLFTGSVPLDGKIYITDDEIMFQTRGLNLGNGSLKIAIQDITGFERGMLNILHIFAGDIHWKLAVWKKGSIVQAIETRRQAWFTKRGMPVPPLTHV